MEHTALQLFHPAVRGWFNKAFAAPTEPQLKAWPAIRAGQHVLIAAPTGSGKTLAAFLAMLDDLIQRGLQSGLADETAIVYVSPLKALSNDIQRNLEWPLSGIRDELMCAGFADVEIRTQVRTGDTPQSERDKMRRRPPHIVVTTPESLYILLTSDSGRKMLRTTRTVIVDEIHAIADDKRGAHLALSLERLSALAEQPITRVGISATQKPIEHIARYLIGGRQSDCIIIDSGHIRERDLAIEVPPAPLEAVMSGEIWQLVYDRLAALVAEHRTTLIFVNTRRMAERLARHLSERLGEENVAAHHGSLAKELRLSAEQRLKRGELKTLVATASLELGIDIGEVDLVCQLASPRSIAAFLQRVGRSGHAVGALPKGRLFPLSRDDLVECVALLDAVCRGELDQLTVPPQPIDVLAQQLVAEVACHEYSEDELYQLVGRAYPYRELTRVQFSEIISMLSEGYATRRGRRSAYLHRDAVNKRLRARRGAKLTAVTSGGTIPDTADYQVILEPEAQQIGTVNEDFAIESMAGDIFQLGNASYRILRVEAGRVRVADAKGQPPTIPFWLGEAPGRCDELSFAVSRLREEIAERLELGSEAANNWLKQELGIAESAAEQLITYLTAAKKALGVLPLQAQIVLERFFDESGGMQLIIHSPYGSRLNRAWGLALRKRFCRKFNFELQAAATEDAIIISLSKSHSFPLAEVAHYLSASNVRAVLTQALFDAPMFNARWRWVATNALALPRYRGGKKVPPQLQRMMAEDLVAAVFPDQLACLENIVGDREIPDHPLVKQTIDDCLHGAMDIQGLEHVLVEIEAQQITIVARDVTEPSPLAAEILNARPYAFLDDAPLEERRTQAVLSRRWLDAESAQDLAKLDIQAIQRVREEAWPQAETADELHDVLMTLALLVPAELTPRWRELLTDLVAAHRAAQVFLTDGSALGWIATERLPEFIAVYSAPDCRPQVIVPEDFARTWTREAAILEILRSRLAALGPTTAQDLITTLHISLTDCEVALHHLEAEGVVMRGQFTGAEQVEWCERALLARIHRYTVNRLRAEIEPVDARDFLRFLCRWQRVTEESRGEGPDALAAIIEQLAGYEAPAIAWEAEILPARLRDYDPAWLDELCSRGRVTWTRLSVSQTETARSVSPVRNTPIALIPRRHAGFWEGLANKSDSERFTPRAATVAEFLARHGASFFDELSAGTGLLHTELEEALAELVARGAAHADSFIGLRALLTPSERRKPVSTGKRWRRGARYGVEDAGRWALVNKGIPDAGESERPSEHIAMSLLRRYGVVFWRLLEREANWLPTWRELLRVYHRLEARGEIRGGRFVAGFSGEQFALPEAVGLLRDLRRTTLSETLLSLCGADPLNLVGILTPDAKVPALTTNRVLYRDGLPIAVRVGGTVQFLQKLESKAEWEATKAVQKQPISLLPDFLRG